jgi:hypothetical protein
MVEPGDEEAIGFMFPDVGMVSSQQLSALSIAGASVQRMLMG